MSQGQEWKQAEREDHITVAWIWHREAGREEEVDPFPVSITLSRALWTWQCLMCVPWRSTLQNQFYLLFSILSFLPVLTHTVACSSALIFGETTQGWGRISPWGNTVDAIMHSQLIKDARGRKGQSGKYAKEWFKTNGTMQDFKSVIKWNGHSIQIQRTILFKQNDNHHESEPT